MPNQIALDTALFFQSIVFGFFAGLVFEFFRFLRLALPQTTMTVFCQDLLFFLPVTLFFLLFTFAFSDGVVRWFSVAGAGGGFFLYLGTLGKILFFFADRILSLIRRILFFLFRKTLLPVVIFFKNIFHSLFTKMKKEVIIRKRRKQKKRILKEQKNLLRRAEFGFYGK